MKRSISVTIVALLVGGLYLIAATACQKAIEDKTLPSTRSVNIYLTDDQSLVFDQVLLDIQKLEVKVEDSSELEFEREHEGESDDHDSQGHTSGGWQNVSIRSGVYDVLKFRNGLDTLFGTASFPSTHAFRKIRLTLGANNSVVYNGSSFPLTLKGNDNIIVIKLSDDEAEAGDDHQKTDFWLDIDAGRSVRRHGNDFELKPQVKAFRKDQTGAVEGRVLPAAAMAVVYAINGTDTTSAKPEREGEFKMMGLRPGTYTIVYHATSGNYQDKTISNIIVQNREDTKLGSVTLQP